MLSIFANANICWAQVDELNIIPLPNKIEIRDGYHISDKAVKVYIGSDIKIDVDYVILLLKESGFKPSLTKDKRKASLLFLVDKEKCSDPEMYILDVETAKISIYASTKNGWLYGLQSLMQITQEEAGRSKIRLCTITDKPEFKWRSYMIDEGRHFLGMPVIKTMLDEMARLKMNIFHWHLVDDTGWRIEIKQYPELTDIGSKKDFTHRYISPKEWEQLNMPRSYYTQEEVRSIIKYADARGIEIIPEIVYPGHSASAIFAYPWLGTLSKCGKPYWPDTYDVTNPKVEEFMKNVLDEIIDLFPSKVIHIGGDEVRYTDWEKIPAITDFMKEHNISSYPNLQIWGINRISDYLESKQRRIMGWNEITGEYAINKGIYEDNLGSLSPNAIIHFWIGDVELITKAIKKGYEVVNAKHGETYLDYSYTTIPLKRAYSFSPREIDGLTESEKQKIIGLGCQMWGEVVPNTDRLYYHTFPRIAAYAEVGWTGSDKKNYENFLSRFNCNLEKIWKEKGYLTIQPLK